MTPEMKTRLEEWITTLVRGMLDERERSRVSVEIQVPSDEAATVLIRVPNSVMQYVIGRKGANVSAVRSLVKAGFRSEGWFRRVDTQIHPVS